MVERLFLAVPRVCLRFVIVVFPDHTHLLFLTSKSRILQSYPALSTKMEKEKKNMIDLKGLTQIQNCSHCTNIVSYMKQANFVADLSSFMIQNG